MTYHRNGFCICESGEIRTAQYDGYGIFLTFTCPKCHDEKMRGFRTDINDRYDCDEPIDEG
jgi:hypothetical protein